tara:strand:- start:76 stop:915 length:840 start_codon:yes stop_codon:yes gene_type:complete
MAINTNISVTETQKQYYQKFINLSVNEEALPQGDGTIRISPFDDFFIFVLYDEIDNEDTPIDLTNVGDIYLSFIGENDQIVIKNHTQVEEVDLSQGEVLFKITKDDSKKILGLDNNNFYVSTKMTDPVDSSVSDETVLYQGIWLAYSEATRTSLTSQIDDQAALYAVELAKLKEENELLKTENKELITLSQKDELVIQTLQASNEELTNEVSDLAKQIESKNLAALKRRSSKAQKLAEKQRKVKQQNTALKRGNADAASGANNPGFWEQAAANLQNYSN